MHVFLPGHWKVCLIRLTMLKTLTIWPLGELNFILWIMSNLTLVKDGFHWTSLTKSQLWYRQWTVAFRQQAISWDNVDLVLYRHMAPICHRNREKKTNKQNLCNVHKYEQRQEIDIKFLSVIPNLHTNCHFKNTHPKVGQLYLNYSQELSHSLSLREGHGMSSYFKVWSSIH